MKDKIISIQILRAVACLLVLQVHFFLNVPFTNLQFCGAIGVDLFFVISGYIIASTINYLPKKQAVANFVINRFSRVAPLYYFVTIIVMLIKAIKSFDLTQFILSILFIPQLKDPTLYLGWSLNHEVFFYLCIALGIFLFGADNKIRLGLFFCAILVVFQFLPLNVYVASFAKSSINFSFLYGFFAFTFKDQILKIFKNYFWLILSIILFILTGLYTTDSLPLHTLIGYKREQIAVYGTQYMLLRGVIWGIPSFLLFVSFLANEHLFSKFRNTFIVKIGDASFSLYLAQAIPLSIANFLIAHSLFIKTYWGAFGFSVSFCGGLLLYNLVEGRISERCKRLLRHYFIKRTTELNQH